MTPILSIITPVYNECRNIENNVKKIQSAMEGLKGFYEIIIVDDNSPNGSGEIADRLAAEYPNIKVIHRPQKRGLGTALKEAFPHTRGEYIAYMDCDMSHDPAHLLPMLDKAREVDVVIGSRFVKGGRSWGGPLRATS